MACLFRARIADCDGSKFFPKAAHAQIVSRHQAWCIHTADLHAVPREWYQSQLIRLVFQLKAAPDTDATSSSGNTGCNDSDAVPASRMTDSSGIHCPAGGDAESLRTGSVLNDIGGLQILFPALVRVGDDAAWMSGLV